MRNHHVVECRSIRLHSVFIQASSLTMQELTSVLSWQTELSTLPQPHSEF